MGLICCCCILYVDLFLLLLRVWGYIINYMYNIDDRFLYTTVISSIPMSNMTNLFSRGLNMSCTSTMRVSTKVYCLNLQMNFTVKWWGFDISILVLSLRCIDVEDQLSHTGWERGWFVFILMSYGLVIWCVWRLERIFIVELV